jgi:hypothetical protein
MSGLPESRHRWVIYEYTPSKNTENTGQIDVLGRVLLSAPIATPTLLGIHGGRTTRPIGGS